MPGRDTARAGTGRFDHSSARHGRGAWHRAGSQIRTRGIVRTRREASPAIWFWWPSAARKSVFGQVYVARHAPIPRT